MSVLYPGLDEMVKHPADEVRLRELIAVLKQMGTSDPQSYADWECSQLEALWRGMDFNPS